MLGYSTSWTAFIRFQSFLDWYGQLTFTILKFSHVFPLLICRSCTPYFIATNFTDTILALILRYGSMVANKQIPHSPKSFAQLLFEGTALYSLFWFYLVMFCHFNITLHFIFARWVCNEVEALKWKRFWQDYLIEENIKEIKCFTRELSYANFPTVRIFSENEGCVY